MQFIAYALDNSNMAKLSAGDWLIPASADAAQMVVKSTKHYGSWRNAISAVPDLVKANWVSLVPYAQWKAQIATPAFRLVSLQPAEPARPDHPARQRLEPDSRLVQHSRPAGTAGPARHTQPTEEGESLT